ncbi:MAG: hypothetical protein BWY31_02189 [Lentisphaerae bacterium ADurb.Bin242]|nr:MAG: hypothetical protein BWY31_02189 [Lentisphaerae bacterium ADurb.Bin242]
MKHVIISLGLALSAMTFPSGLRAADVPLTSGKEARCVIVLPPNASDSHKFAASELAGYLEKLSGGVKIAWSEKEIPNQTNIHLCLATDRLPLKPDSTKLEKISSDGYLLLAVPGKIVIISKKPRGLIFGVYNLLKKYGDIRWLTPGDDGEYYTVKNRIDVPEQETLVNPASDFRAIFTGRMNVNSFIADSWKWMLRNGIVPRIQSRNFSPEQLKFIDSIDPDFSNMGHVFTPLLLWSESLTADERERGRILQKMFEESPEMFPLINGRREMLDGQKLQPCTTNEKTIETMKKGALSYHEKRWIPGMRFLIGNNDGTGWCQCAKCLETDRTDKVCPNSPATRYWTLVNRVGGVLLDKYPEREIQGWAYQNFSQPPYGVVPDKRITVLLVYNDRCYRHRIDDPHCQVNKVFRNYFAEWKKFPNRKYTWEQIDIASGQVYTPIEKVFADNIRTLAKNYGCSGMLMITCAPDGIYKKKHEGTLVPYIWYGMWQTLYLGAAFLWDHESDYEKLYEEAGALYYGKAWNGGMKAFRALLAKAFEETPGCYGCGRGASPLGRCLDSPGTQETLAALLESAEKSAASDPDKRVLAHVRRDKMLFERTWLAFRQNYLDGFREFKAYEKKGKITVDGKADEPDWKNADNYTNFKKLNLGNGSTEAAGIQTFVKFTYEPDNLYLFVEALEPYPDKMLATEWNVRADPPVWKDNSIDIFLNHRELGNDYFQISLNHKGKLFDAVKKVGIHAPDPSPSLDVEAAIKIGKDRWTAEIRIPTAKLGGKCITGNVWMVNVGRSRKLTDGTKELSSIANGYFHNFERFIPLTFSGERTTAGTQMETDTSPWKNATFGAVRLLGEKAIGKRILVNRETPAGWNISDDVHLAMPFRDPGRKDRFVHLEKGRIYQINTGKFSQCSISFELKGKGNISVEIYNYSAQPGGKLKSGGGTVILKKGDFEFRDWTPFRFDYLKKNPDDAFAVAFKLLDGYADIDNVFVTAK